MEPNLNQIYSSKFAKKMELPNYLVPLIHHNKMEELKDSIES